MKIEMAQSAAIAPSPIQATVEQLEKAFLAEMLKYCGPAAGESAFSGGAGEQQFESFLTEEYAGILADSVDLGLARFLEGNL